MRSLLLVSLALLSGCHSSPKGVANLPAESPPETMANAKTEDDLGFVAFQKTLYPLLRANCVACHGDNGRALAHSSADPRTAYENSKEDVDFFDVPNSSFAQHARSKHWLRYDPLETGLPESDLIDAIRAWWSEGEFFAGQTFAFKSLAIPLPENLPSMKDSKFAEISWDFGLVDPKFEGCTASLEIQKAMEPAGKVQGSYRVRNLAVSCTKTAFKFKGFHILVSDQFTAYENIFASDELSTSKTPQILPSSREPMILLQRLTEDTVALAVEAITPL